MPDAILIMRDAKIELCVTLYYLFVTLYSEFWPSMYTINYAWRYIIYAWRYIIYAWRYIIYAWRYIPSFDPHRTP